MIRKRQVGYYSPWEILWRIIATVIVSILAGTVLAWILEKALP